MNNETTEAHIVQTPNNPNLAYGQPITPPGPPGQVVLVNQTSPSVSGQIRPNDFKIDPIALKCPYCGKMMATEVNKDVNVCACLLCWCTCLIFYVAIQAYRGKSLCCWNAEHRCPFCRNLVGHYSAC